MGKTIRRVLLPCLFLLVSAAIHAQASAQPAAVHITLGQAAAPLYGPWRFTVGDSPIDPAGQLLWAEPGFDDTHWETVDLTPPAGSFDPMAGSSGYVPGWTTAGHRGYWAMRGIASASTQP